MLHILTKLKHFTLVMPYWNKSICRQKYAIIFSFVTMLSIMANKTFSNMFCSMIIFLYNGSMKQIQIRANRYKVNVFTGTMQYSFDS